MVAFEDAAFLLVLDWMPSDICLKAREHDHHLDKAKIMKKMTLIKGSSLQTGTKYAIILEMGVWSNILYVSAAN